MQTQFSHQHGSSTFLLACGFAISLILAIYGVFAMSCALDVPSDAASGHGQVFKTPGFLLQSPRSLKARGTAVIVRDRPGNRVVALFLGVGQKVLEASASEHSQSKERGIALPDVLFHVHVELHPPDV